MTKKRLIEIDKMTGLAILLVVIGHLANPDSESNLVGSHFYFELKKIIYLFHMPLFMFLSGVIFFYTYKKIGTMSEYTTYVRKKFIRLIPAFIIFASIMLLGKIVMANISHVENFKNPNLFYAYYQLFIEPMRSFARSLWYIYVLFEYYVFFGLILIYINKKAILVIIGVVLYFCNIDIQIFALNQLTTYFIFFSLGIIFIENYKKINENFIRFRYYYVLVFIISFFITNFLESRNSMFFIGLFSIPAIYSLVIIDFKINDIFNYISKYTFSIYLMNMIFIGFYEAILLKFIPLLGFNFNIVFPFIVFLTISSIIITKKYILKFIPILNKITN